MRQSGPACATCREKCRRCDRARPHCRRCLIKGLDCGGYPDNFRFCGLAIRGKWKGKDVPASEYELSNTSRPLQKQRRNNTRELNPNQHGGVITRILGNEKPADAHFPAFTTPDSSDLHDQELQGPYTLQPRLSSEDLPTIDHVLASEQTDMLLAHYGHAICPHQIAPFGSVDENPYRVYVLPLAYEHIGLLFAVLALSACHLGHLNHDKYLYESVAVNYRIQAIMALGVSIKKGCSGGFGEDERDSVFATIQILLLYDICESGISEYGAHISGGMSICIQLLSGRHSLTKNHKRTIFFLGNLIWLDIVRAFSAPERLSFNQDLRKRILMLGDLKFEAVNGCPKDLALLIGELLEHAKANASGSLGVERYKEILQSSIQKLCVWDSSNCQYPDNNPLWIHVGDAFRHTCMLRALRLLDVTESAEASRIQTSVTAILNAVSKIPKESPLIELMILPIFMAGVDCIVPYSQHYIVLRIAEIKARSEMSNAAPIQLLNKVWHEREKNSQTPHSNIPWMSFTRSSDSNHQHDYLII